VTVERAADGDAEGRSIRAHVGPRLGHRPAWQRFIRTRRYSMRWVSGFHANGSSAPARTDVGLAIERQKRFIRASRGWLVQLCRGVQDDVSLRSICAEARRLAAGGLRSSMVVCLVHPLARGATSWL
jgi:hypothetical protein